jgi:prephenate dehydrogenase
METVAIFGVGLIGGSFALALKKAGFSGRIIGVSSRATIEAARRAGAIDDALPAEEAARIADLCYLAQPIAQILETLPQLNLWVRPETLVTDAGSTKGLIVARATETLSRCEFLGGHPLAGKERRGVENANPDLFRGRTYVLTPPEGREPASPRSACFVEWLDRIGAQPLFTRPEIHDQIVAYTSHLPQLTSTALAACVAREVGAEAPRIWGPALVDSTRLALSPFDIWGDILKTNAPAIDAALARFIEQLQQMRENLTGSEVKDLFEEGAKLAHRVRDSA